MMVIIIYAMSTPKTPSKKAPSKGERTHERIVRGAARAIRSEGYQGVSVAEIMKEAGLTHGGFYAHFPSREELLVEALDCATSEGLSALGEASRRGGSGQELKALVEAYLSEAHAERPERGCSLAALGSETRRQSPKVRQVATRGVRKMVELIERQLPEGEAQRTQKAMAMMSTMVGALLISRVVNDRKLAQAFRAAAKQFVLPEEG